MNQRTRLNTLKSRLESHSEITVEEACKLLDASPATIRRDFRLLTSNGEVEKTWGGIAKKMEYPDDMKPLSYRSTLLIEEKRAITKFASELIQDGDVVIIDGGTTTLELAKLIVNKKVRIITNSLLVANYINLQKVTWKGAELFLTGGFLYPGSGLLVGPEANKNLLEYHADWTFLSPGGLDEKGLTNSNQLVVENEKTMIAQSDKTVVLADYSKIGTKSMCKVCDLSMIHMLVTNKKANPEIISLIKKQGVDVELI